MLIISVNICMCDNMIFINYSEFFDKYKKQYSFKINNCNIINIFAGNLDQLNVSLLSSL